MTIVQYICTIQYNTIYNILFSVRYKQHILYCIYLNLFSSTQEYNNCMCVCIINMICWYLYIVHVISTCTAAKTLFILPDNVSDVNCPSQPCAPLSQYLLDNGSLPVLSNVIYHFLPGQHSIHGGINLMKVHSFSFIGFGSSPAKFVCRSLS